MNYDSGPQFFTFLRHQFLMTFSSEHKLTSQILIPPLKWAGGKRWFVANYGKLLPDEFDRYVEPFLGSGALFFGLNPARSILSDVNSELINLYEIIRDQPIELQEKLEWYQLRHSKEFYYKARGSRPRTNLNKAARFLYLNRTCFNGLYRVNLKGEFNVPKGSKDRVVLETDNFELLSSVLKNVELCCQDFEETLDMTVKGDFAFVDPPYTVAHNHNGFVKYNQNLFDWSDQVRLRDAVIRAADRGVKVLVTNAAHSSVMSLYKDFEQILISRAGVISGAASARGQYEEMVARWY